MSEEIDTDAIEVQHTRERLRFIELKRRALSRATRLFDEAKVAADAAKNALKVAQIEYNAAGEQEDPPLLNAGPVDEHAWRDVTTRELGFSDNVVSAMAEKHIDTLGDLSDWLSDARNNLTDLRGVGPGKADAIEAALERFWADHPEYAKPDPIEEDEEDGTEGESDGD